MRSATLTKTALAAGITVAVLAGAERQNSSVSAASLPNDDKAIVHVLNRIGFGPRPGDIEKVRAMGLQTYIDQQLHPERIPDASMDARLAGLTTLRLSSREIAQQFALPALMARRDRKQDAKQADTAPAEGAECPPTAGQPGDGRAQPSRNCCAPLTASGSCRKC